MKQKPGITKEPRTHTLLGKKVTPAAITGAGDHESTTPGLGHELHPDSLVLAWISPRGVALLEFTE